jgi:2-polyprenyl-3-methyl-5-hydroxy-6-metoxy-1,4-benzoquinol methylase
MPLIHFGAVARSQDPCRICGSFTIAATLTRDWEGFSSTWVRCQECGVEHIDPYPGSDELAAYYDDSYVTKSCPGSVSHAVRYSDEYARRMHEEYALGLADVGLDPERVAAFSVLDFGCAEGVFLDFLRDRGHDSDRMLGADISPQMVERAVQRGHRAVEAHRLEELADESFDLITLWDVIEHVPEPAATVAGLVRLLAPDGRLLVETPRMGLLSAELREEFEHYLPFEHVHLFPRETLIRLFAEQGLEAIARASFGANAPQERIPQPYKTAFDLLAKATDNGSTQLVLFARPNARVG